MAPITDPELFAFVESSGLEWITASAARFSPTLASALHKLAARVFVHTVNDPEEIASLLTAGANGVYTDGLKPRAPEPPPKPQRIKKTAAEKKLERKTEKTRKRKQKKKDKRKENRQRQRLESKACPSPADSSRSRSSFPCGPRGRSLSTSPYATSR